MASDRRIIVHNACWKCGKPRDLSHDCDHNQETTTTPLSLKSVGGHTIMNKERNDRRQIRHWWTHASNHHRHRGRQETTSSGSSGHASHPGASAEPVDSNRLDPRTRNQTSGITATSPTTKDTPPDR
ncbi:GM19285 [Drosophila sechellia]|uniref:GM19285 n=1 Tax=Drosophila sechellia TaxID=7238 RepID=B4ILC8_DROSE|nr:GM19285 [Drosophila sechellia]